MNRDRLEKILPSEKIIENGPREQALARGYNLARKDCLSALLKSEVGVVPSESEMHSAWHEKMNEEVTIHIAKGLKAIRTLMQGGFDNVK